MDVEGGRRVSGTVLEGIWVLPGNEGQTTVACSLEAILKGLSKGRLPGGKPLYKAEALPEELGPHAGLRAAVLLPDMAFCLKPQNLLLMLREDWLL